MASDTVNRKELEIPCGFDLVPGLTADDLEHAAGQLVTVRATELAMWLQDEACP